MELRGRPQRQYTSMTVNSAKEINGGRALFL